MLQASSVHVYTSYRPAVIATEDTLALRSKSSHPLLIHILLLFTVHFVFQVEQSLCRVYVRTKDVTYSRIDVSLRPALLGGDGPTVIRQYRGKTTACYDGSCVVSSFERPKNVLLL